jgi:hypothetical protein
MFGNEISQSNGMTHNGDVFSGVRLPPHGARRVKRLRKRRRALGRRLDLKKNKQPANDGEASTSGPGDMQ